MEPEIKKGDKVTLKPEADTFELAENQTYVVKEVVYLTPFDKYFLILEDINPPKAFDIVLFRLCSS